MTTRRTQAFGFALIAVWAGALRTASAQAPAPPPTPAPAQPAAPAAPAAADAPAASPPAETEDVTPKTSPFPTVFTSKGLDDNAEEGQETQAAAASASAADIAENYQRPTAPPGETRRTVGMLPSKPDLGAEADMVSTANEVHAAPMDRRWTYVMAGYLRAPARVGYGPRNDLTPGSELHAPPRIIGLNTYEWTNVGLAPAPEATLFVTVENARAAGTVIIQANTFWDVGFKNVESLGGVSQAYVTLKWPRAFNDAGGLMWTLGGFSNRYGNAGPRQQSSGYYQTQLFGRTHVLGEALTADIAIGENMRLILEHGIGAKTEVIPWLEPGGEPAPPRAPWLPEQGPQAQGSTYVHHAHAALEIGTSVMLGAHYLSSWSPNDFFRPRQGDSPRAETASMSVIGAELHVDSDRTGNGYIGYSHVNADNILPLGDGLELLHSRNGVQFTDNFLDPVDDEYYQVGGPNPALLVDSGTVDTVLFQYMFKLGPALGWTPEGPDLRFAAFGMYNVIKNDIIEQSRLKFGGEVSAQLFKYFSGGVRFDQVRADGNNAREAYTAITPRLILHSTWVNREYIILSYTRYILGADAGPSRPYDNLELADPNLFVLSAAVSF
jgi:hypothetical protein